MNGYYKNEKMTKATFGMVGYTQVIKATDMDNYLYITGRVADSFKTSKGKFIEPLHWKITLETSKN